MRPAPKHLPLALITVSTLGIAACDEPAQDDFQGAQEAAESTVGEIERVSDRFVEEARTALSDLTADVEQVEARYADPAAGELASAWDETGRQIDDARQAVQNDLDRLANATGEEARQLQAQTTRDIEMLTHRIERARLEAAQDAASFMAASRERMAEIDADLDELRAQTAFLPAPAQSDAIVELNELTAEATALADDLDSVAEATAADVEAVREGLTEGIAALSASVRRQTLQIHQDVTAQ